MAELEPSIFTTTILTSKTPLQSATIVDENVKQSKQLNRQMIQFFENYVAILQQQNYSIKNLLSNQSSAVLKFLNTNKEFGLVANSWNDHHQILSNSVNSNDQLIKFLKMEILSPLMGLTQDIKFSELLISNQELQELVSENPIDEYRWNTRSMAIFETFKAFKTAERNLIVNQFINLFNFNSSSFEKSHHLNQNNLSHLLDSFNIDSEMDNYLNSILNNNYPLLTPKPPVGSHRHKKSSSISGSGVGSSAASTSSKPVSHRQSKLFHSDKDKKEKTKLRSRVGSIFGKRKSKSKGGNDLDSVYSNQTANTALTNLTNLREDDIGVNNINHSASFSNPINASASPQPKAYEPVQAHEPPQPSQNRELNQLQPPYPPHPSQPSQPAQPSQKTAQTPPQPPQKEEQYRSLQPQGQTSSFHPPPAQPGFQSQAQPVTLQPQGQRIGSFQAPQDSPSSKHSNRDLPIITPAVESPESVEAGNHTDFPPKSPNVIKYSDSSDDEIEHENGLPNVHANGSPEYKPVNNLLTVNKSRHTQYSFDSGDDLNDFKTSPKIQKSGEFDFPDPDVNGNGDNLSVEEEEDTIGELRNSRTPTYSNGSDPFGSIPPSQSVNSVPSAVSSVPSPSAPAPPPARRVTHNERRGEIQSQIFHSLPQTRDSVIEPPQLPHLNSQTTGNSLTSTNLRRSEMFHHDELNEKLIAGLNVSNSQIINVNFKQDNLAKSSVIGELAFNYQGNEDVHNDDLIIRIPNSWNKTINNTFIESLNQEHFKFNPSYIMNKTLGGIKYMQNNLNVNQIPLFIHSIWKFEEHQSSLIVSLSGNPSFGSTIILDHLQVSVALDSNVDAHSASSKPTGTFNKEKNRITWKYDTAVALSSDKPERLIARFMTNGKGSEDSSGIQVKFSISDVTSDITCNEQVVNVTGNLSAGNYNSNS